MKYNFNCDYVCERNGDTTLIMALKEKRFDQHLCFKIAKRIHQPNLCDTNNSVAMMHAIGREFRKIVEYLVYECMYLMQ